jgi:hypothetical protein
MELYMSRAALPAGPEGATPLEGSAPGMRPPVRGYLSFFINVLVFLRGLDGGAKEKEPLKSCSSNGSKKVRPVLKAKFLDNQLLSITYSNAHPYSWFGFFEWKLFAFQNRPPDVLFRNNFFAQEMRL